MDDTQEEYFGTYLKIKQFATTNASDLAVNPSIATQKNKLDNLINAITLQDALANMDYTGFTTMKDNAALSLRDQLKKVGRGLTSYFAEVNHPGNLEIVKKTNSEINYNNDGNLNMLASSIYLVGNKPAVKTDPLLAHSQLVAADIDDLETARVAWMEMVAVPKEKRGDHVAANKEKAKLFESANKTLLPLFDNLMAPFETTNPILFSKYTTARAIDNLGGGSGTDGFDLTVLTIPAGGSVNAPISGPIPADKVLYIRVVTNGGALKICMVSLLPAPCPSPYELSFGTIFKAPASDLGLDLGLPNLQISNAGTEPVIVRFGVKTS